jgi:hypothetical protein
MARFGAHRMAHVAASLGLAALLVMPVVAASQVGDRGDAPGTSPATTGSATAGTARPPSPSSAGSPAASTQPAAPASIAPTSGSRAPDVSGTSAIVPGSVNRTSLALTAEYDVSLSLNYGTRAFNVFAALSIRNDSGGPIDRVELNTVATRLGAMKLVSVTVAGQPVSAKVSDQTITVPLGGILGDGQSVGMKVRYRATLRSSTTGSNWLFTRANGIVDAHRWIPWVSKPLAFNRPNHGDPFVTPVSPRVRVTVTTDRPLTFATSGERVANERLKQTFEARNVRDFALTASPDYRTMSSTVGDTIVRVYYRPGTSASTILSAAKRAIAKMEALVGPYPYKVYRLAQTAGGYGMESPGLTWIPSGAGNLTYLVTHETGHQWFYGIVGNDQAAEPFTDEAATDFLARYVLGQRRSSRCSTARLDLSIYRYSSACYYEIIYIQGGNFLDDIRRRMGNTAFWAGLRDYVASNRFALTRTKTLLDTLDAHTPLNLVPRFEPRFPRLY